MFDVRPMFICEGESVAASWELNPTDAAGAALGLEIFLAWALLTGDIVPDGTRENRVVGGDIVTPDPNMGSRTFFPTADRRFFFDATIEGLGALRREQRDVRVVAAGGARIRTEAFQFRCSTGDSGGPGWTTVTYERGQLASAGLQITGVQNVNHETIMLSVKRDRDDEMLPPLIVDEIIAPGDMSTVFNGEYYGVWTAVPVSFSDEVGRLICETPVTVGVLGLPPAAPETPPENRLEAIRIEVTFGCVVAPPDGAGGGKG
ncbi:MAG: hypothetical protein ACE5E1_06915 [Phycisphaerae bacterium]